MRKFKKAGPDTQRKYLALRRRFGLSKQDWLGSQEKVQVMKEWHEEKKEEKEVKFLRQRGRLGKKQVMPVLPDARVERSDAQLFNDFTRDKQGNLNMVAKRRSTRRTFESSEGQVELQGLGKFQRQTKTNQM